MTTEILVIIAMLVVRIGIPLAVVMGLSWLAYRWLGEDSKTSQPDVRPSAEAPHARLGGPAPLARVLYAGPYCWDVKGCTEEAKAKCPACARPELPCWLAVQMKTGHLNKGCTDCQFYEQPAYSQPAASA